MNTQKFTRRVWIDAPAEAVFTWHARHGALERLLPPWEQIDLIDKTGGIESGSQIMLRVPFGPFKVRWTLEHRGYESGRQFQDVQTSGPFRFWEHTHRMVPQGEQKCYLEDQIEYSLGILGNLYGNRALERKLERLFRYRHRILVQDLKDHRKFRSEGKLKILVTGASGLVGSSVTSFFRTGGHQVLTLTRSKSEQGDTSVYWDPIGGSLKMDDLEGLDAVVHLAGENIGAGRWTDEKKDMILKSRTEGTKLLCDALACLKKPPKVLVSASAIGFYGDRGDEILNEGSAPGEGFLANVCQEWEAATQVVARNGIRIVNMRFGIVLDPKGGALEKMLPPFKLGGGGILGDGEQYMSWISLEDVVGAIHHAIRSEELPGPVNFVAPTALTNKEFTRTLGRVLRRPTLMPMPARVARMAFGEKADALLLSSSNVTADKLIDSGYKYRYPDLEDALRNMLGR